MADEVNGATDAPFSVFDGTTGGTLLDTSDLDQTVAPTDHAILGDGWQSLGTFSITADTITVQLTDDANGRVIADGVKLVEARPTTRTIYNDTGDVYQEIDALGNVTESVISYQYEVRRR